MYCCVKMALTDNNVKKYIDGLQDGRILNFHRGACVLPEWAGFDLRLMMGAGDLDHGGVPNIQRFSTYNVFYCLPLDWNDSLRKNVDYLLGSDAQTLLCFVDNTDANQVRAFCTLFAGRFSFIDGHGGHCPHFDMWALGRLLAEGGTATNIFEMSEALMTVDELEFWLEHGFFHGRRSENFMTSRVYRPGQPFGSALPNEDDLKALLAIKIRVAAERSTRIDVSGVDLTAAPLGLLQTVMRVLMFDCHTPVNLRGSFTMMRKDWHNEAGLHFIITKHSPDYSLDLIAQAASRGHVDVVARAHMLIEAINKDLALGTAWGSVAKYRTYKRHIEEKVKPLLAASAAS